tara:strand:- start:37 stop:183 length:147 start_codon:yes stop_codon:yes gene_type:complete
VYSLTQQHDRKSRRDHLKKSKQKNQSASKVEAAPIIEAEVEAEVEAEI